MRNSQHPLTDLLKKNTPYKWEPKHQEAMEQLKQALTSAPVLILPDPERDSVIEADASDQAVGAVLMQDQGNGLQPIAYLSKKLHGAELNYPIHDKEALAIVIAFKAWRCYLEERRTTVYTNHCSLKYLKTQPNLSRRQVRWIEFLETHFHYDIVYKPDHKNKADALSRPAHVAAIQIKGMNPLLKGLFTHGATTEESGTATASSCPIQPWQVVSLDFITGLPTTTSGHDAILIFIDKFSQNGTLHPDTHDGTHRGDSTTLRSLHHLTAWHSNHTHLRPRPQVHQQVLEGTSVFARDQTRHVIRLPSKDRRTDLAPQPDCRATTPSSLQGRDLQMGLAPARSRVCLQQHYTCRYWTDAVLPLL
ncbi:hypothetical protein CLOP_g773 [Closterium sp. NIES-67]|nr:hypothetical protein CLOP_g773 [Closterium sp. NIES-67]